MNGPYYGFLGCPNPSYDEEIAQKESLLSSLFGRPVSVLKSPTAKNYRNKVEFTTTPSALGLKSSWDTVVDVEECLILDSELNAVWKKIRLFIKQHEVPCFDVRKREGWLRYVTLRKGEGVQVVLTTASDSHKEVVEQLFSFLDIKSLWWMVNADREGVQGECILVLGSELLSIPVFDKSFLTRPDSFFQANTHALKQAISCMQEHISSSDSVLDLYCGVGVIGQCLKASSLQGVEVNPQAIKLAQTNADNNNISAEYFAADVASFALSKSFDVIIVDPPRSGLQHAVHTLLAAKPKKIVYLSCNPKTQRRDLAALKAAYDISSITGIDFFPRTEHVECLVTLDLRF